MLFGFLIVVGFWSFIMGKLEGGLPRMASGIVPDKSPFCGVGVGTYPPTRYHS